MKRSILFWPLVVGAAVCLLWGLACFVVVGVPASRGPGSPAFSSPVLRLVGATFRIRLTRSFVASVNGFWRFVPYCGPRKSNPDWEQRVWGPIGLDIGPNHLPSRWVVLSPLPSPLHSSYNYNGRTLELSPGEVLGYVVLVPGVHFALAAFFLALVVNGVTRVLSRAIRLPEGTRLETRKE